MWTADCAAARNIEIVDVLGYQAPGVVHIQQFNSLALCTSALNPLGFQANITFVSGKPIDTSLSLIDGLLLRVLRSEIYVC